MNAAPPKPPAPAWLGTLAAVFGGRALPVLYAAWALPFLLLLAWVTPPWQNPDEPLHFARAVHVARGGFVGWRQYGTTGGESDRQIYAAYDAVRHAAMQPAERLSRADLARSQAVKWGQPLYTSFPNTAQYPPFFYLPDALCTWVARAAHLHIDRALLLARLLNALCFSLLAAGALTLACRTRLMLLAVLMLPTTLSLACSASQDALAEGCAALAVALIDRAAAGPAARAPGRQSWWAAALLTLVALARPPYVGFLLVLGLGARPDRRIWRQGLVAAAIVAAWCALVALHTSVPFAHASPRAQLALLAAHPADIVVIPARTLGRFALDWWVQLIGVLGWTDTYLPAPYIIYASLVVALAALAAPGPAPLGAWRVWAGCLFAGAAILVLQFLTWTWPGQDVVTGVLGRYFTMPAIVAALGLPGFGIVGSWARRAAPAAFLALAFVTPAVVIHAVVFRYYVQ